MKRLIILDRDGVINFDSDEYIKSAEEWQPLPGSIEAVALLKKKGFFVAVASNQSGLARGLFTLSDLASMHEKFFGLLAAEGVTIDDLRFCPHGPDDSCDCRKPKPGMLHAAMEKLGFTPGPDVVFIGDSLSDLEAARSAGISAYLVKTGKGERTLEKIKGTSYENTPVYLDLMDAVRHLVNPD